MALSLNRVMLIGTLGRDPEIRSVGTGTRVATLSIATSQSWKDKNSGEWKERVEWHRVTVWPDSLVSLVEKNLSKGSRVYVSGQLETRKWTDQSGQEKYSTEVVLRPYHGEIIVLDRRERTEKGAQAAAAPDFDDEIPF